MPTRRLRINRVRCRRISASPRHPRGDTNSQPRLLQELATVHVVPSVKSSARCYFAGHAARFGRRLRAQPVVENLDVCGFANRRLIPTRPFLRKPRRFHFGQRLSRGDLLFHELRRCHQHTIELFEIFQVPQRPVSGNDLRIGVDGRDRFLDVVNVPRTSPPPPRSMFG